MLDYVEPVTKLIDELKRLRGIGRDVGSTPRFSHPPRKTASRPTVWSNQSTKSKEKIVLCSTCNNITDVDPCHYCSSSSRDKRSMLVVEEPYNLVTIEKTRDYKGLYHVLHGALSPIRGIGPDDLKIKGLLDRLRSGEVEEIILATNPNTEREATANTSRGS
jgi:recombination protein RecR